jgi:TP901 family phage tail tape measure protein
VSTRQVNIEIRAALGQAFQKAFSTTEDQLSNLKKTIGALSSQAASVRTLQELRDKVSGLTAETAKYDAEIVRLKGDLQAVEAAQLAQKTAVAAAKKEMGLAGLEVQKAADSHLTAKAHLSLLTEEFARNKNRTREHKKALEEAAAAVDKTSQTLKAARAVHQQASSTYTEQKNQLTAATAAVQSHQKAIDKATRSHDASSSALKAASGRVDQYEKELKDAGHDVNQLANAERKLGAQLTKNQAAYADVSRSRMLAQRARELRSSAMSDFYALTASTIALGTPIKIAGDFEQAIAKVGATTSATSDEIAGLAKLARDLGRDTVFSATDAANAQSYLGQAGFTPREIQSALPATLKLAEAGETDLADTANMASNMLRGFNLDASAMARVGDVLTATFVGSNATLRGLAETMKYVAPIASALGSSIEEVSASAGVLGNVGIQDSMAGTALRSLYSRLSAPPAEAKKALEELGVRTRDKSGNFRGTQVIIGDIAKALDRFGTAERMEKIKKIGGEEAAAGTVEIIKAKRSGVLDLEIKKLEMAPAFRAAVDELKSMSPAQLKPLAERFGISIKDGMSKAQIVSELPKIFAGVKGPEFEARFNAVFPRKQLKKEALPAELNLSSKAAQKELQRLNVSQKGYFGENRSNEEITGDVLKALEEEPQAKRDESMAILFSRSRDALHKLTEEAAKGQKSFSELAAHLEKTNSASEISEKLNTTTWGALKNMQSCVEETAIAIGSIFLPTLADLLRQLSPLIQSFAMWVGEHKDLTKWLGYLAAGFIANKALLIGFKLSMSSLAGVINFASLTKKGWLKTMSLSGTVIKAMASGAGSAITSIWNLAKAIQFVSLAQRAWNLVMRISPIGLAVTAAVALGAAAIYVYKNWDSIKVKLAKVFEKIAPVVKTVWDAIKPFVELTPLGFVIANWDKVVDYFRKFADKIKPYFKMIAGIFSSDSHAELKLTDGRRIPLKELSEAGPELPGNVTQPIQTGDTRTLTHIVNQKNDFHMLSNDEGSRKAVEHVQKGIRSPFRGQVSRTNLDPVGAF